MMTLTKCSFVLSAVGQVRGRRFAVLLRIFAGAKRTTA